MKRVPLVSLVLVLCCAAGQAAPPPPLEPLDPGRVREIEAMLPAEPQGVGPRITERAAWEALAQLPAYQRVLKDADKALASPIPDQPDDLFLLYSKTGDRDRWQSVAFGRRKAFAHLVFAECLRNDGRYLGKIADYARALCAEPTWVYPAHDSSLANFHGKAIDIDLGSSTLGFNMATALWMLGDKLDPDARRLIVENLQKRIIGPFHDRITGKAPLGGGWWWMAADMNWNTVCLAGSVGTALAVEPDRHTRAQFVLAGDIYSRHFLAGFPKDGYCTEGLGYWNYGFGRFVMLSETLRRATGGRLDLLARPEARLPAEFGRRIQMARGISPAFADCAVSAKPDPALMHLLNNYYHLGLSAYDAADTTSPISDLAMEAIFRPEVAAPAPVPAQPFRLRDYFDTTGVLIARPAPESACKMAVALKGGSNHEAHNHNDVGSYVVLLNDKELILDPGPERYTARTFSKRRYESKLLNSFGHDVPLVAGQLQREGPGTDARILKADFSHSADTFSLDIASAYSVPELKSLTRTWTYSRQEAGMLTVSDKAAFSTPQSFGTALITTGKWQVLFDGRILIEDGPDAVLITVKASDPYTLSPEIIRENAAVTPTRLGINLKDSSSAPEISLTIVPRP